MDQIFKTSVLSASINLIKPFKTMVLDLIFGRKKTSPTENLMWDVQDGSKGLIPNIKAYEEATVADKTGFKTVTCVAPRYAQKKFISQADVQSMRAFGSTSATQLMKTRVGEEQADIRSTIDRTREFAAIKALEGQVLDSDGATILVDYKFTPAQLLTLTGTQLWSDPAATIIKNLKDWKKQVSDEGSVDKFICFAGTNVMPIMVEALSVVESIKTKIASQVADSGTITNLFGIEFHEVSGSYLDAAKVKQDMLNPNKLILVGWTSGGFVQIHAPAVEIGAGQELYFSKAWDVEDPNGKWVKGEARPLPALLMPSQVVNATVL